VFDDVPTPAGKVAWTSPFKDLSVDSHRPAVLFSLKPTEPIKKTPDPLQSQQWLLLLLPE
jgi:hypothetical protein